MIESKVKTKQGDEAVKAYSVNECYLPFVKFEKWSQNKTLYEYAADFAVLDTETSHADLETAWVYQWAVKWRGQYIYGRKPSELIELLVKMRDVYKLNNKRRIIIYIHNASYDIEYLKEYLCDYDPKITVMATDSHTFLITDVWGFRILCSYKLSNMSLAMFSGIYSEKYIKAAGRRHAAH